MAFKIDDLPTFPIVAAEKMLGRKIPALPDGETWPGSTIPGRRERSSTSPSTTSRTSRLNPADVRGKLVIVGASAPSLQDRHATSTSGNELMPGPEIQAVAAQTALAGFPLARRAGWVNVLLVIALGVLAPLAGLR